MWLGVPPQITFHMTTWSHKTHSSIYYKKNTFITIKSVLWHYHKSPFCLAICLSVFAVLFLILFLFFLCESVCCVGLAWRKEASAISGRGSHVKLCGFCFDMPNTGYRSTDESHLASKLSRKYAPFAESQRITTNNFIKNGQILRNAGFYLFSICFMHQHRFARR